MIPWLKDILYDPNSFANFVRAGVYLAAEILPKVVDVGATGWWVAEVVKGLAFIMRAGDKNTSLDLKRSN